MKNIIFKLAYLCSLLLLVDSQIMAQAIPQALNDTRTFEVSACKPSKNDIVTVWMEKRPERKDNDGNAANMRVAYKSSTDNGQHWTEKGIVDAPNTFGIGNPFVTSNANGDTYLVCMHIGKDFYAGNISLYEFDFVKKQFNLKSIPFKSENQLLDKPSIVVSGDEIHLVYVAYPKRAQNAVKYQMSKDKGKTWTEPVDVFVKGSGGYLGPAITLSKDNQVIIACGAYGRKNINIVKRKVNIDSIAFETPIVVNQVSATMGAAMTELSRSENKLILTWQNPHQRNEAWLSFSRNEGNTWSEPFLATGKGNLLSAVFDKKENIHCIYADFSNEKFFVGYKMLNSKFEKIKEDYLLKPVPLSTFNEYLGAYQKLMIQQDQLFAFWIDYPNNNTLNFTKWAF